MLTYFSDSVHWAKGLERFSSKKFDEARYELISIKGARKNYSEYLALLATINIILNNIDPARGMLIKAIDGSVPRKQQYKAYIDRYCRYYLSVIDGNEGDMVRYLQEALKVPAPNIIRQWLPLS